MAITERLALLVTMDANGAIKGFNDLGKAADRNLSKADTRLDRFASKFQKAGAGLLAGAGFAAAGLFKTGQAASDLEQAMGGTEAVFGDASDAIDRFAKTAAQAIGLSESEFRTATTSIGGQLKGLGFTADKAADQAVNLTKIGADLAATYGGTTAEAVAALGSAFRGEADPAEKFNLFLNQTRVNAKAVELGLAATTAEVSANAKAQATLSLITEQSADALGGFGREADTAAGAQARMIAELKNTAAALGQGVAPIVSDLASGVGGLAQQFNDLPAPAQEAISKTATYGTIAAGALGATSLLAGKVLEGRDRFRQLSTELPRTSRALTGVGKAAATLGPLLLLDQLEPLGFLNESAPKLEEFENALARLAQDKSIEGLSLDLDKLGRAVERVGDPSVATKISDTATRLATLGGHLNLGKNSNLDEAKQQIDALDSSLASLATRDPSVASAALNAVAEKLGVSVRDLVPLLDSYGASLELADTEQLIATASMDKLSRAAHVAGGDIDSLRTKFDELTDTLRASVDADFAFEDSIADTESALRRLAEAQGIVVDENTSVQDKQASIAAATRDLRDSLLSQADAYAESAAQAFEMSGKTLTAAQQQQLFRDKLAELTADLGGPLKTELDEVIARMDHLAQDRKASLEIEIRESRLAIASERLLGPDGGRRAIGGPVTAGHVYSANEYGKPEYFIPSVNGTVEPGPMTGVTSQAINITVNNPVPEPASTSIRKLRTEGALMGSA